MTPGDGCTFACVAGTSVLIDKKITARITAI
jgi:hypothetical protein